MILTYLFVPAHEERKVAHAMSSNADAIILDLEASVPKDRKDVARQAVVRCVQNLRSGGTSQVWVRVNPAGSEFTADLEAIDWSRVDGAVVAQAEDPDVLRSLEQAGSRQLLPLIESVKGFGALADLARSPVVERFAIGTWDLALDLRLLAIPDPDESELIWQLRGELVVASRRLGLAPPIDGVCARLDESGELRAVCDRAYRMGFAGKLLIHPKQIEVARSVFGRDNEQLQRAREIVEAYERASAAGLGAIQVRGQMIDQPMVERARALLARWPDPLTR